MDTLLLMEYQELLDRAIARMKKDYPDFVIYSVGIDTDEYHYLTTISFDDKENSMKYFEIWQEEYDYWMKAGHLEVAKYIKRSKEGRRNYYYPDFRLYNLEEICHNASLENWHDTLKEFGKIAFERIKSELKIDPENFELGINSPIEWYDESWNIKDFNF